MPISAFALSRVRFWVIYRGDNLAQNCDKCTISRNFELDFA